MTVYHDLLRLGYTDEDMKDEHRSSPRTMTLFTFDTPDGYPIVGINYQCDYKAEEEWGVGGLRKAFDDNDNQMNNIVVRDKSITLKTDDDWYESETIERGEDYIEDAMSYVHYGTNRWEYNRKKLTELKEYARKNDINIKGLRKKDDVIDRILASRVPKHPNVFPGWFQTGSHLVLPKGSGIVGKTLEFLLFAAEHSNSLSVGNSSGVFSTGLAIFDKNDIGPKLQAEIDEANRFYEEHMEKLKPVEKELKAKGHSWFYLGKPTIINPKNSKDEPEVHYWLNGGRGPGYSKQPFGWYTLQELRDEKFVSDVNSK